MKLFDLYIRILKKQVWLYGIYLAVFFLFIVLSKESYVGVALVTMYYRYAVLAEVSYTHLPLPTKRIV